MKLPTIKELVKNNFVSFSHYQHGELWYHVVKKVTAKEYFKDDKCVGEISTNVFTFPVPIADAGDGRFLAHDKALMFMRYIRKHLANLKAEQEAFSAAYPG